MTVIMTCLWSLTIPTIGVNHLSYLSLSDSRVGLALRVGGEGPGGHAPYRWGFLK
jgi:hypothetical protein